MKYSDDQSAESAFQSTGRKRSMHSQLWTEDAPTQVEETIGKSAVRYEAKNSRILTPITVELVVTPIPFNLGKAFPQNKLLHFSVNFCLFIGKGYPNINKINK